MIILSTSAAAQNLKVIARDYLDSFIMSIRDDSTNVSKHYEITGATTVGNYLTFTNIFNSADLPFSISPIVHNPFPAL